MLSARSSPTASTAPVKTMSVINRMPSAALFHEGVQAAKPHAAGDQRDEAGRRRSAGPADTGVLIRSADWVVAEGL